MTISLRLPKSTNRKQVYIVSALVLIVVVLSISISLVPISNKNDEIAALNEKVSTLNNDLFTAQSQTKEDKAKLNAIAFAVHPESEYATFRKKAYVDLFHKTFPNINFDENDISLVRVFNTTSFREAGRFFADIENDDIVVYDSWQAENSTEIPAVIIRPREQKVIASGPVSTQAISKARSGNKSMSIFGPTPNYFSQQ